MTGQRLAAALGVIDAANAADPNSEMTDHGARPAALLYGQRMTGMLERFAPRADELVMLAARAQHIERWTMPRDNYPRDRPGYLKWRADLKRFHGERIRQILVAAGYPAEDAAHSSDIVQKRALGSDPDSQTIEDVACLVFLTHTALNFAHSRSRESILEILVKTLRKMSPEAIAFAQTMELPEPVAALLAQAVEKSAH
jgi:hypothetical protein